MSHDYHMQEIREWRTVSGLRVPFDQYDHALDVTDIRGNEARDLTSPYGRLAFAVGTADDFVCFDHARVFGLADDGTIEDTGCMALHSVWNTETGCSIERLDYDIVPARDADEVAECMLDHAIEVLYINDLEHDAVGWGQDTTHWLKCVKKDMR